MHNHYLSRYMQNRIKNGIISQQKINRYINFYEDENDKKLEEDVKLIILNNRKSLQ